jgi:uncharacterized protein (TIGR02996 family)
MTDGPALLRAILEDPADDAPRLVFADWLDEQGRPKIAARIRHGLGIPTEVAYPFSKGVALANHAPGRIPPWARFFGGSAFVSRGFVSSVQVDSVRRDPMLAYLFATQPVTEVRLTDKRPRWSFWTWTYSWDRQSTAGPGKDPASILPDDWYLKLARSTDRCWPTEGQAVAALSKAIVTIGRRLVGLPALT